MNEKEINNLKLVSGLLKNLFLNTELKDYQIANKFHEIFIKNKNEIQDAFISIDNNYEKILDSYVKDKLKKESEIMLNELSPNEYTISLNKKINFESKNTENIKIEKLKSISENIKNKSSEDIIEKYIIKNYYNKYNNNINSISEIYDLVVNLYEQGETESFNLIISTDEKGIISLKKDKKLKNDDVEEIADLLDESKLKFKSLNSAKNYLKKIYDILELKLNDSYNDYQIKNIHKKKYKGIIAKEVEEYNEDNLPDDIDDIFERYTSQFLLEKNVMIIDSSTDMDDISLFITKSMRCQIQTLFVLANVHLEEKKNEILKKLNEIYQKKKNVMKSCLLILIRKGDNDIKNDVDLIREGKFTK